MRAVARLCNCVMDGADSSADSSMAGVTCSLWHSTEISRQTVSEGVDE